MDQLLKEIKMFEDMTSVFTIADVALVLILSFVLVLIIGQVYKKTHRGISYSQSFVSSLVLMTLTTSLIMLIIGSNLARAFSLVGALSIIRFRNAVKESRDVSFMFFAMAIGMACGTRFYLMAIFATIVISVFVFIVFKLNLFSKEIRERILIIEIPIGFEYEKVFFDLFKKYFSDIKLISMEKIESNNLIELVFNVTVKSKFNNEKFIKEISQEIPGNKISIIEGQQEIDL